MDDAQLLRVSLLLSVLGLVLLFWASNESQVSTLKISEVDFDDVGNLVSIEGKVKSRRIHDEGHIFLKVEDDTAAISAVIFSSKAKGLDAVTMDCLEAGGRVSVTGKVEEYRGTLEVVPRDGDGLRCSTS